MALILVVDDQEIVRFTIVESLRDQGHQTLEADNGRDALNLARLHRPTLMLLDVLMPDVDGLTVLAQLRSDPSLQTIPVVMLTRDARREDVHNVVRMGVKGYVLKTCFEMDDFIARIRAVLAGIAEPAVIGASETPSDSRKRQGPWPRLTPWRDRTAELDSMAPLCSDETELSFDARKLHCIGPIARRIVGMARHREYSVDEVARLIKVDPVIALRVVQIANSSLYAAGGTVTTVERAVAQIGMEAVARAVDAMPMLDDESLVESASGISVLGHAEHGILCSLLSGDFMACSGGTDEEIKTAELAGLIHDLGTRVLAGLLGRKYARVLEVAGDLRLPLEKVEGRLLFCDHAEFMCRLLVECAAPQALMAAVVNHHRTLREVRRLPSPELRLVAAVAAANQIVHGMAVVDGGRPTLRPIGEFCQVLRVDSAAMARRVQSLPDRMAEIKAVAMEHGLTVSWPVHPDPVNLADCPVRFIDVSEHAALEPHAMYFGRFAGGKDSEAALLVAAVHAGREMNGVAAAVRAVETREHRTGLPLLLFTATGRAQLDGGELSERSVAVLPLTVDTQYVTEVAADLLQDRADVALAAGAGAIASTRSVA